MFFRYLGIATLLFIASIIIWGDHFNLARGDLMASIDYPKAAYDAYQYVVVNYPRSPLRKSAQKKMDDLLKGNDYLKGLIKKDKEGSWNWLLFVSNISNQFFTMYFLPQLSAKRGKSKKNILLILEQLN